MGKLLGGLLIAAAAARAGSAGVVTLKNGLQIEGQLGKVAEIGEDPLKPSRPTGPVRVTPVVLIDDELRRVFVPSKELAIPPTEGELPRLEQIRIQQRVAEVGRAVASVGPIIRVTPFDEWGRRIFTMNTARGPVDIIQGITLVTPTYCKVEGLLGKRSYVWDMRVATSSIPRQTLSKILKHHLDPKNSADRLRIVRLYIQAERYEDARAELEEVIRDFPRLRTLDKQVKELRQASARRILQEIQRRTDAGQHQLAVSLLRKFPAEGVAAETLLNVRDMLDRYQRNFQRRQQVLQLYEKHLAEVKDAARREQLAAVQRELNERLNFNTLERMADYLRLADDSKLTAEQKLALAVSGWLLGSGAGIDDLKLALQLVQVRELARQYLQATRQHERDAALGQLQALEAGQPKYLAQVIAHMLPLVPTEPQQTEPPGLFQLSAPGLTGEPDFTYYIQLPPEYDPLRRYPCVVTLHGAGTTPLQQIDWWAGSYVPEKKIRLGQATRHGYIVLAPAWAMEHQSEYKFTAREHAAVLYTLRDALRRFSIDTDRVFLSGHSMGGDAAWDIGLAHPDLWAGVIPIVATADKYISRYYENARHHLPLYFVSGELDGDRLDRNKMDWNRYMRYLGYDVIVVQYRGRGHEHFHDEIQQIFRWMDLPSHRRDFFPREFTCVSMRPWDNFFWWVELDDFPKTTMVMPIEWPRKGAKEAETTARILKNNTIQLRTAADRATIWLAPDMVDLGRPITLLAGSRRRTIQIQPSIQTLLDDVRSRADRQHPFWAKIEVP